MRDVLGPGTALGYCTNVHSGTTLDETKQKLRDYALKVKQRFSPNEPMGVGLWLSARVASELLQQRRVLEFRDWLCDIGLVPFTFNGFPFGDFHGDVVKHAVYQPPWWDLHRALYTLHLAKTLVQLLPEGGVGGISTLPLGWPSRAVNDEVIAQAAKLLTGVAEQLSRLEQDTGRTIHLDIEPEPGCLIGDSASAVSFFQNHLMNNGNEGVIRHHLRVCHDICHAAVMFEDQEKVFEAYQNAGIQIGKVQISSAVRADLRSLSARERIDALAQLRQFSEDRYLHQTMINVGNEHQFFDDLPHALDVFGKSDRGGDEWRVHFHVPIYIESFGLLRTTRDDIVECMRLLRGSEVKLWEVETYSWNVLPAELQVNDLAEGIAKELIWVQQTARNIHESG